MKQKEFKKLSKTAKRVAIAKDVIKQLKTQKFIAEEGVFLSILDTTETSLYDNLSSGGEVELQGILNERNCNVCALGGLFASCVVKEDNFKVNQDHLNFAKELSIDYHDTITRLSDYFTPLQLVMIEVAFEKGRGYFSWELAETSDDAEYYLESTSTSEFLEGTSIRTISKALNAALVFGQKYQDTTGAMIAIMKNIIKNNGTFKP